MARKETSKKPLFGNNRSHNMQNVVTPDGKKVKMTAREAKKFRQSLSE